MANKLLIIDGLNVVRRIYEANPAPDSQAKVDGAVKASVQSVRRALNEHQPSHAVAFFDAGGPTWRHALYPDYRKSRKPMPTVLREALPRLYEVLRANCGLASRSYPGIEADDAFAQLALQWRVEFPADPVTGLSTDKDLAQLVAAGVSIWDHFERYWRDEAWITAKFGVPSALLGDLLALMGDASDDIPGVTKVGVKTAAGLLNTHGSLAAVLAAAAGLPGKLGMRLVHERENALLSRALVAFKTDSDLGLSWEDLRLPVQG